MTTERELIGQDIEAYLRRYQDKELLRFVAVGSVDDGKSTLIGRLLYDTGSVYEDQLAAVRKATTMEGTDIDLSLITDGLAAEREQGITIDVAYRYFTTDKRKFIIADTPGHVQYTRNMVTGASTANVAIILIDARLGVLQQSRRHAYIASLLGIPHLAVCVNKMDLVAFDRSVFERIREEFAGFTRNLSFTDVTFFPISALTGANCVRRSEKTPWYEGPTVLEFLETVPIARDRALSRFRYPVQTVLRPNLDYRAFAGQLASGVVRVGDEVKVLPSGKTSRVKAIDTFEGSIEEAFAPQSVAIRLEDEVDVSRGDMLVHPGDAPKATRAFDAHVVWLHESGLDRSRSYLLKHTTRTTRVDIAAVEHRIDMDTLDAAPAETLALNDIGRVSLVAHQPLFVDPYAENRGTGSFILIDPLSNNTVGAGLVIEARDEASRDEDRNLTVHRSEVTSEARASAYGHRGATLWLTGLSGAGKSTIAYRVEKRLVERGVHAVVLDGDEVRTGLGSDLGFSDADRSENLRRASEVARLLTRAGTVVLCAFVSPRRADREAIRARFEGETFAEVHVATPIEVAAARDPKGLYAKAKGGGIGSFTGVSAPYEEPTGAELVLDASEASVDVLAGRVVEWLEERGVLGRGA